MSSTIKQAIEALKGRIADAYTAIVAKGGTLPATQDSANLPSAIASIPSGGGDEASIWAALKYGYIVFANSTVEFEVNATDGIPSNTLNSCFNNSYVTKINISSTPSCSSYDSFARSCQRLIELIINDSGTLVTSISSMCNSCGSLVKVVIGGSLANCTAAATSFLGCGSLTEITLPQIGSATSTTLFNNTFANDSNLAKITMLGDWFSNYNYNAFANCRNLKEIAGGIIDISASSTNGNMFINCDLLEDVLIKGCKSALSLAQSPNMKYSCLLYLIENLQAANQTLNIGSVNLAKMQSTAEGQNAIAYAQSIGWTIV